MKHTRSSLLGALAGLAVGLALIPTSLGAFFLTTPVTWDGSTCEAGTYTITSTATNVATSQTYVVTTPNVVLPRPAVVQNFQNLSPGAYAVSASLRGTDGQVFTSAFQTFIVGDGGPTPPAPTTTASASGRRRPPSAPVIGMAQPRDTPPPPIGYAAGSRRTVVEPVAPDPAPLLATGARAVLIESLLRLLAHDPSTTLPGGGSVKVVDADADGVADFVGVTIGGVVWILRVRN